MTAYLVELFLENVDDILFGREKDVRDELSSILNQTFLIANLVTTASGKIIL